VESSIYYFKEVIQANGDVFQINELICDFPDHDEQNP